MTRTLRPLVAAILLALVAPLVPSPAPVAAVDYLDPTFGSGGKTLISFENSMHATALALQSDGKIVVVGGEWKWGVARFKADGTLDTTFGGDGIVETDNGLSSWGPSAVAIQSDGKIVVVGFAELEGACCASIARYNTNGSLDSGFDGDGMRPIPFGTGSEVRGVAVQGDGKIVVAGNDASDIALARFTSAGALDATFGTGGTVTLDAGAVDRLAGVRLQSDGRIVAAGSIDNTFLVARFTSSGAPDATFDDDGIATVADGGYGGARALALQSDGKIVVAGSGTVARLTAAGALDPSFSDDGVATASLGSGIYLYGVAVMADGRILAIGETDGPDFGVVRFAADGWPDARLATDFGGYDRPHGIVIQPDGKFVVAGGGGGGSPPTSWALARYADLPPIKTLSVEPFSIDFGIHTLGTAADERNVSITNTGSGGVALSFELVVGSDPGLTADASACPATLAARASCDVVLRFEPVIDGPLQMDFRVHSDAENSFISIPLSGTAIKPPSSVTWSTRKAAGPAYTWNGGGAMARTLQSGTQRLHLAYATNRVNGAWAKDTGPYVGIYYIRSTTGATWSTPKRLNPTSQHAARLGLAAAGARVYATWVSQAKWVRYSGSTPRVLYVRVNTGHGASTAWKSTIRLTSTTGRVDYPTIAATGSDAHIAYTNSGTGAIRVASSRDGGATWSQLTIGSTSIATSDGRLGLPSVAVSGSTVVVAWISDTSGTVKLRVSTNRGVSWGTTETVGSQSTGAVSAAVRGTRIAVAWTTPNEVVVRQRLAGTWEAAKLISRLDPLQPYSPYGPQVVLQGTSSIGLAWSEERPGEFFAADLNWAESANGGALWFRTQAIARGSSGPAANDWPSVVWPTAGTRYIAWNGWTPYTSNYRLYFRTGTGIPVTPTVAPEVWTPSDGVALPWSEGDLAAVPGARTGPAE